MSAITAALGGYATFGVKHAGMLVDKTYDEALMSINYARAAAADFANIRAAFARLWIASDPEIRAKLAVQIGELNRTLHEDIAVAAGRSQSERAKRAAANVNEAVDKWTAIRERMLDRTQLDVSWETLDQISAQVDEQIDLLINYTAGDGFLYRQSARATVAQDVNLNILGTALALLLSGAVAAALVRRIVRPVAAASNIAASIATGRLDVEITKGGSDELGRLLRSMARMRDNIKEMMDREVAQRRSAQAHLAVALGSSQEGILIIDADDRVVLANAQAGSLLKAPNELLAPGALCSELRLAVPITLGSAKSALGPGGTESRTRDIRLTDGRWLRISKSATPDGGLILVCSDITVAKQQEVTLRQSNRRLDAALDNMSQGLCLFDAQDRLEVANRRFFEIFGLSRDDVPPGTTYRSIVELSIVSHANMTVEEICENQLNVRRLSHGTHFYELADGRAIACMYNKTGSGGWVATYEDVTERRRAESKIMHMARHDALTNLPNRVLFREKMEQALARGEDLAVLFLDLDRFKGVNDTLGHSVGDALLCAVTKRLQRAVRGADIVARLGGDEFAIIQIGARPTTATELASRIIADMSETFDVLGHQVVIGTSIGIAVAPTDGNEPDQLLRNADMALYRAKSEGRGTYHFFQPEMDAEMQARRSLELDLRKALLANEFEIYYQPLVDLGSNTVSGFEALLRWNHPQRGLITPDHFISVAEEIGLIGQIGDWVLKQACRDAASWPGKLTVAVNLSAVQFRNPGLSLSVVGALAASGLSASRLELEITETVLLQDDRSVLDTLHQIKDLGVRIAMDDFGTGYSSLSYLRRFPFDKIKIDRSFIRELGKKDDCVAIIRAITRLARSLGMVTTAEGVETEEQLAILRKEACTQVQGYYFSRPQPLSKVPAMIERLQPDTLKPATRKRA